MTEQEIYKIMNKHKNTFNGKFPKNSYAVIKDNEGNTHVLHRGRGNTDYITNPFPSFTGELKNKGYKKITFPKN